MNPGSCWPANLDCCCCGGLGTIGGPHRDLGFGCAPLRAACGPHRLPIPEGDGREGGDILLYPPPAPTGFSGPAAPCPAPASGPHSTWPPCGGPPAWPHVVGLPSGKVQ